MKERPTKQRHIPHVDQAIAWITEPLAALIVVVEVVILFAGVIARYAFNRPLLWSDELAAGLFLWLALLGSVIALRRGEHMRMTALVNRCTPTWRRRLTTASMVLVAMVAVALIAPAQDYMTSQWAIFTPALHLHDALRVAGLLAGMLLLLIISVVRLLEECEWHEALATIALGAIVASVLWFAHPAIAALGDASLIIFFIGMVGACVAGGVPIAFSFMLSTLAYLTFDTSIPLSVVVSQMDQGMSSLELLAVPLFVLLGLLLETAGIAKAIVDFFALLVGHLRGGLSYVLFIAMFLISGISGSKAADQAAVAPVLFPEMKKRGWEGGELVAQLAAAGAMSETIPPSLVLIIIGSVTSVSILALFTGGLLPATLAAIALFIVAYFRSDASTAGAERPKISRIARAFIVAVPGLVLPLLIRVTVLGGVATATEVSTVAIFYTIAIGMFVYRTFTWRRVYPILIETASLSGAILLIIGAATAMGWALTQAGFARDLFAMVTTMPGGRVGFMAISIVIFLVLGSILEGIPSIVLVGPLMFPVARQFGINDVQYTMVVILAMGIGLFAPPFGVGFYQSCLIGRSSSDEAIGRIFPYLGGVFAALLLVAAIPWLSTGFLAKP
ncbi:MAG TPA: TRAP transporter large permease subunit [Candidatus Baltobacteraceae bacterium]|nr:TRAP transporter large permease subunit [Candidatus Baltobacteraceae bacterium]